MSNAEIFKAPFSPAEAVDYASGSIVSKQLTYNDAGNITLFAFDEGQQLSEHTAPFDAVVQVVDGEAEIRVGGQPHTVGTGQMIVMPANVPHALYATRRFKMILTMIKG